MKFQFINMYISDVLLCITQLRTNGHCCGPSRASRCWSQYRYRMAKSRIVPLCVSCYFWERYLLGKSQSTSLYFIIRKVTTFGYERASFSDCNGIAWLVTSGVECINFFLNCKIIRVWPWIVSGSYAEWLCSVPELLGPVLSLTLTGIENSHLASPATLALKDIVRECKSVLLPFAQIIVDKTMVIEFSIFCRYPFVWIIKWNLPLIIFTYFPSYLFLESWSD